MSTRKLAQTYPSTKHPLMPMDDGARLWTVRTARKNLWRVCGWYDLDDLVQDGSFCWFLVANRYPKVTGRGHFMALYQTSFMRHINDLSNLGSELTGIDLAGSDVFDSTSDLDRCIAEAPRLVKRLLRMLMDNPQALMPSDMRRLLLTYLRE